MDKIYEYYQKIYEKIQKNTITIIFGEVGKGKTSLLTFFGIVRMICGRERFLNCMKSINYLRNQGFDIDFLPQKHTAGSNFEIKAACLYCAKKTSYPVNPFKFALPNCFFKTVMIPPYFDLLFTESQSHLNARESRRFRPEVSRAYENARHAHYTITLDTQRFDLLDLNVRAVANKFIKVLGMDNKYDKLGNLIKTTWHTLEFDSLGDVLKYSDANTRLGKKQKYTFYGNIYACYNSYENQAAFFENADNFHHSFSSWEEINNKFLVPPESYYKGEK